jgi:predicted amidohydrolase
MAASILRTAAIQMLCQPGDLETNLARSEALARQAVGDGQDLIVFPESVLDGYTCATPGLEQRSRNVPGPETERIGRLARELDCAVLWSLPERAPEGVFNSVLLFGPQGELLLHYRKVHLCREVGEVPAYLPGSAFPVVTYRGLRLGVMVCFDRHYPEAARSLRLQGAQLILHPSATIWFRPDPLSLNTAVMRTRAYENRCFILSINQANYGGGSALFGPYGEVLAVAGEGEQILRLEVDPAAAQARPEGHFDILSGLRPEIYARGPA